MAVESDDVVVPAHTLVGRSSSISGPAEPIRLGNGLFFDGRKLAVKSNGNGQASHTHPIADITDLQTTLDGKAASAHTHAISEVTNLQTELNGKAPTSHSHPISEVTNLQTSLDGKANTGHTHAQSEITNLVTDLGNKSNVGHTHPQSDVTNLTTDLAAKVPTSRTISTTGPLAGGGDLSANRTLSVTLQMSITSDGSGIKLDGDAASPGNSKLYGTNGSGVKGWYNQPTGGGGGGADPPEGSYAPGSYTIATGKFRSAVKRQQFSTTEQLTIQGTGRLSIHN